MNLEKAIDIFDDNVCDYDFDETDDMECLLEDKISELQKKLDMLKKVKNVLFKTKK